MDVHKNHLIGLEVDENLEVVVLAQRVELLNLQRRMKKNLTRQNIL